VDPPPWRLGREPPIPGYERVLEVHRHGAMVDLGPVGILGIDHVQVAVPRDAEDEARAFYGAVLGLEEIPKPEAIRGRGGVWFRPGAQELHLGVAEPFSPAQKAHPGLVAGDLDAIRARLDAAARRYEDDGRIAGVDRLFVDDPFGNRLELRQA